MASNLEIVSSCPVCFISYNGEDNKPLVLPCGHPVCSSCLNTLQERNDKKCPVCKTSWEEHDVSKFIMCYPLIMDECALMKCLAHDFEILFWCTQCFKMICKKCVTNSHSNCHLKVVEDAGDDMKSYLVSISSNLNAKLSRMESELSREMDSNYKCRVDAHLVHTFSEQMMIMLNKRKEDLEMTQSMLQSTKGYSQNALNEVFDDGYNSSTRQLLKLQEIFNHLECSNDISVPKKDDSMGPILDVIPKLKHELSSVLGSDSVLFEPVIKRRLQRSSTNDSSSTNSSIGIQVDDPNAASRSSNSSRTSVEEDIIQEVLMRSTTARYQRIQRVLTPLWHYSRDA